MQEMDGGELLEIIKYHSPHTECITIAAVNDVNMAVDCIKKGAYDYLLKPITPDDLIRSISHAWEKRLLTKKPYPASPTTRMYGSYTGTLLSTKTG